MILFISLVCFIFAILSHLATTWQIEAIEGRSPSGQLIDKIAACQPIEEIALFIESSKRLNHNLSPPFVVPSLLAIIDKRQRMDVLECLQINGYLGCHMEVQYYAIGCNLPFLLPKLCPIAKLDDCLRTAIFDLATSSTLEMLLDHGLDPLTLSWSKRQNLLMSAAVLGAPDTRVAERLVSSGADVNYRWPYDTATPLTKAVDHQNLKLARLLLGHGASILAIACDVKRQKVLRAMIYPIFRLIKIARLQDVDDPASSMLGALLPELHPRILTFITRSPNDR